MLKYLKSKYQLILCFLLIVYLLVGTGLFSDEFMYLLQMQNKPLSEALRFDTILVNCPLSLYLFKFFLFFANIGQTSIIDALKVLYIAISIYLIFKFFSIYLSSQQAAIASFLFAFFPSIDSVTYFFIAQQFFFAFAFYCYAYYLAFNNKFFLACVFSFLGSFVYYGSPPIALGLFALFILNKQIRKAFIIYVPNIIFILYYLTIIKLFNIGDGSKFPNSFNFLTFAKYFVLQLVSFIDAMIGPSMWLKVYYSFYQLSLWSWIIGLLAIILLSLSSGKKNGFDRCSSSRSLSRNKNINLIISFTIMLLASFAMFSFTGKYPQMAFNLGNRTTIYGAFILAYLIAKASLSKKSKVAIYSLMILVILGISDHWKNWTVHQQEVIKQIKDSGDLRNQQAEGVIYISGNQYSKYGPISHIEFFSEDWVADSVFKLALNSNISAKSLNKRHKFEDGYLMDTKYDLKNKVGMEINIYDSQRNIFFKLNAGEINGFIDSLPNDDRHWIQMLDIKFVKDIVKTLMPRLKYVF